MVDYCYHFPAFLLSICEGNIFFCIMPFFHIGHIPAHSKDRTSIFFIWLDMFLRWMFPILDD